MNYTALITDNIAELLVKIIEFTQTRHKILIQNIYDIHNFGFVPKDFLVDEFSEVLNDAINEHIQNRRLVLRDTENIKFSFGGAIEVKPVIDTYAEELLRENQNEYIKLQINKLLENSLNQRIAAELLRQKQTAVSVDY